MMTQYNSVSDKLNDLLTRAYDAEEGYSVAAELTENEALKSWLSENSRERRHFGERIKNHLLEMNVEPDQGTSLSGQIHQTFMKLRSTVNQHDDLALIAECIRGENQTLKDYQETLSEPGLQADARQMVEEQAAKTSRRLVGLKTIKTGLEGLE